MALDRYWAQAQAAIPRDLDGQATVLLPEGDWDRLRFAARFYRNTDVALDISGHEAVLVHKAMLGSFSQKQIGTLLSDWTPVFANSVFAVFSRAPVPRQWFGWWHLWNLEAYVRPRSFYRRRPRRCAFLHVPKAAGTSAWSRISPRVRSKIYFSTNEALAGFTGDINEFEVVGGHFLAETLLAQGWDGPVFFILRDPVARVLSSISHARREDANVGLFDATFRHFREMGNAPLSPQLRELLYHEGNVQCRMLGARSEDDLTAPAILLQAFERASHRLQEPGWSFGLVDQPVLLASGLSQCFRVPNKPLPLRNSQPASRHHASEPLASRVRDLVEAPESRCMDSALLDNARGLLRLSR